MHFAVKELASKHGVELSSRSCSGGYLFDGKSVALYCNPDYGQDDFDACRSQKQYIGDFQALHEIAHFVVAEPWQRDLPELGLMVLSGFRPFYPTGGARTYEEFEKVVGGLLDRKDQDFQEACAYFLGLRWCEQYGIEIPSENQLEGSTYFTDDFELGWRAITKVRGIEEVS